MRKRTLAALTAAALVAAACGSDPKVEQDDTAAVTQDSGTPAAAAPSAKAKSAKIGSTLTVTASGSVTNWTVSKLETKTQDQYGTKPDNGGKYVLIEVKASVKDGTETYVCACDLSIISKSGRVYEQTYGSFKGRPDFQSASVASGQNTDGWVFFGVAAKDLPGSRIQLKQTALFDDSVFGYWTTGL